MAFLGSKNVLQFDTPFDGAFAHLPGIFAEHISLTLRHKTLQ
jgi:hypothetical protein